MSRQTLEQFVREKLSQVYICSEHDIEQIMQAAKDDSVFVDIKWSEKDYSNIVKDLTIANIEIVARRWYSENKPLAWNIGLFA